jgi:hypothetical protein
VSLLPCSVCKKRPRGRLATVYLAFFNGQARIGERGRFCGPCAGSLAEYVRELRPIPTEDETIEWPETCPGCGISITDDFDPTYMTIYMPKSEAVQLVVPQCSACARVARETLRVGMDTIPDRQSAGRVEGASAPSHEAPGFPEVQWHF